MNPEELHRLIAAWLDGRITETDSAALQEMLRTSAEARAEFRRWTQLDATLREQADRGVEAAHRARLFPYPVQVPASARSAGW